MTAAVISFRSWSPLCATHSLNCSSVIIPDISNTCLSRTPLSLCVAYNGALGSRGCVIPGFCNSNIASPVTGGLVSTNGRVSDEPTATPRDVEPTIGSTSVDPGRSCDCNGSGCFRLLHQSFAFCHRFLTAYSVDPVVFFVYKTFLASCPTTCPTPFPISRAAVLTKIFLASFFICPSVRS